jgi:hypothetical protein
MTRGIHLKHLTATDLGLLGLPEDLLGEGAPKATRQIESPAEPAPETASESDPVLSHLTQEVRVTLEETLILLDQALAVGQGCRSG